MLSAPMLRRPTALLVGLVLVAAACSDDSSNGDAGSAGTEPPATEADTTESAATEPAATPPADTEPPDTGPPATEAPATDPPATEPPATEPPVTEPVEPEITVGEWMPFDGGPDCKCADGSEVNFLERRADPEKVVLYFEGGGACFTPETCAFDGPGKTYVSDSDVTPEDLAARSGIFDADNLENPLADYSFVYVPYCTGDVHLGEETTTYSDELTVHHNGFVNATAGLDHMLATYPDATDVVVAGASAGSVPTPLFAGLASDGLPDAEIATIGDSSSGFPGAPELNAVVGTLWGTAASIPDWPETAGITLEEWGIPDLYVYAGRHDPEIDFGTFDYAFDEVQIFFDALAGAPAPDLLTAIDGNHARIEAAGVQLASYVAPGTAHTIVGGAEFYELEVEGVRLVDFVTELVDPTNPPPADVHCETCQ